MNAPRVLPVGDAAVSVVLGDAADPSVGRRVRAMGGALASNPFDGFIEAVPGSTSLLVLFEPSRADPEGVLAAVRRALGSAPDASPAGALHVVPTLYGGDAGPDLADVARATGLSEGEVVALHAGTEYTAEMLGFMPGFAYLGPLARELEVPRRATPRTLVRRGSIAIANRQTGIYPGDSPGGWNLIGRTSLTLFDPYAESPSLIHAGDRVRFTPVDALEDAPARPVPEGLVGRAVLEIVDGGLLTTVQDLGRFGLRRLGVPTAGAMDAAALLAANAAVGNPADAAGLECTLAGPLILFLAPARFALAGADLGAVLDRSDLGPWNVPLERPVLARPGSVLRFRGRRSGCRAFVAFAGGLDVPVVLGSRSTDLVSRFGGLGGRPLRAGDRLALGAPAGGGHPSSGRARDSHPTTVEARVVLGPQTGAFEPAAVERLLAEAWGVTSASDRVGLRLAGPSLRPRTQGAGVSEGLLFGSIEVPPDGQPIVMMADAPTTGGYPRIATVVTTDLPLLAQLVPGEGHVRFEAVDTEPRLAQ